MTDRISTSYCKCNVDQSGVFSRDQLQGYRLRLHQGSWVHYKVYTCNLHPWKPCKLPSDQDTRDMSFHALLPFFVAAHSFVGCSLLSHHLPFLRKQTKWRPPLQVGGSTGAIHSCIGRSTFDIWWNQKRPYHPHKPIDAERTSLIESARWIPNVRWGHQFEYVTARNSYQGWVSGVESKSDRFFQQSGTGLGCPVSVYRFILVMSIMFADSKSIVATPKQRGPTPEH